MGNEAFWHYWNPTGGENGAGGWEPVEGANGTPNGGGGGGGGIVPISGSLTDTDVNGSLTLIGTIDTSTVHNLYLDIVAGANALTAFTLIGRVGTGLNDQTIAETTDHYLNYDPRVDLVQVTTGDLTALPAATAGGVGLDVRFFSEVSVYAQSGGASVVTVDYYGS